MANVTESETYDAGVYRIETIDQVVGGETGISNKPTKNLANRTKWLKARVDELIASIAGHAITLSGLGSASTKIANATKTTGQVPLWDGVYSQAQVDAAISSASFRLAKGTQVIGDIVGTQSIVVALGTTLANANYMVFATIVSKGTSALDSACTWSIHSKTTTSFTITLIEYSAGIQNIDLDWEIKAK